MAKHLQNEIERLKKMILALSAQVEESVHRAVCAIQERDTALAQTVLDSDEDIDHTEVEVEEECLKILALHQPVANDLRFIIAVLKINNDLERVGDLAVDMAERALFLSAQKKITIPFDLPGMAVKVQAMLKKSLDALIHLDPALARDVCAADQEVDAIHRDMYQRIEESIISQPQEMKSYIALLSTSRYLERMADHATNIAEDVIYMVEGEIVRHRLGDLQPS